MFWCNKYQAFFGLFFPFLPSPPKEEWILYVRFPEIVSETYTMLQHYNKAFSLEQASTS